jgi:hypothetical protein
MAQDTLRPMKAMRVLIPPKIDGVLDEDIWKTASPANSFFQSDPNYKAPATQKTEVRILYDNEAIYIGAFLYDTHPDSIFHELGKRDDGGVNSDMFIMCLDPYNKLIDAYIFGVTAAGVQLDTRLQDETFDAVWQSAVKINDRGWCAEFRIPYSAIRFPGVKVQDWRVEFHRQITRRNELSRCPLFPKDDQKIVKYFAHLEGISDIQAPARLALIPYISVSGENSPDYNADGSYNSNSSSLNYAAGADIKYGINDRFTLDATLLPDFTQVQSDNKVKNLSYREIVYQENRPFFKEGLEIFNKQDLFYSRRIGGVPSLHDSVQLTLGKKEVLEDDPSQARILNSIKVSGRTNKGLGIGFFNSITDNTYATVRDSLGNRKKILTQPFTNYNILVLDQHLKNSSSVSLVNTSVLHDKGWINANVTGLGFEFLNKKNNLKLSGEEGFSQRFKKDTVNKYNDATGYKYGLSLEKIGGNWTYGIKHSGYSNTYNQLDLGYYLVNNQRSTITHLTYDQFEPNKFWRISEVNMNNITSTNFVTGSRTGYTYNIDLFAVLLNYLVVFGGGTLTPLHNLDYFEPRVSGYVFQTRKTATEYIGMNSDSRKPLFLQLRFVSGQYINENTSSLLNELNFDLRLRLNDRFSIFYGGIINYNSHNEGFAALDSMGVPVMGSRSLSTIENHLQLKYIFNPTMSLSLNGRHYWNTGRYKQYYSLRNDGSLAPNPSYHAPNDFSYNVFNIDLVYTWIFAPGSSLSLNYKNAIEQNTITPLIPRYSDDLNNTFLFPQTNIISLKLLYYLDYQDVKKRLKKNRN